MADLTSDTVEYKILMEATQAIQDLNALTANATSVDEKMRMVAQAVLDFGQKIGVTAPVAEALFKRVETSALNLQATMEKMAAQGLPMPTMGLGPLEQQLAVTQPVFPAANTEMWRGVSVQVKEIQTGLAAAAQEGEKVNVALEKSAASASSLSIPIKTATEQMAALKAFAEGQKGQGILQNFLGGYQGASTISGQINTIKTAILQLSTETGASFQQAGTLLKTSFNIPDVQVTNAIKRLNDELGNVPERSARAVRGLDAIRIALGAIVAMIVFQAIQAITTFFSNAIKSAREYEGVLYNIANAERIMSQQGVEIAPKDFDKMIADLQKLVPMMSQLDATKAIGNIALFTKDLGYTKDQVNELAQAVGVLYVRNRSLGLSFEQVQSQVQTGLLTGRAQGIRDLGVSISESQIENEALRMGLVKTDKEFKALTGDVETQVKAQAMLGLILRSTAEEQKNLGQYMQTADAQMGKFSASVSNLGLALGKTFAPAIGGLAKDGTIALNALVSVADHVRAVFYGLVTSFVTLLTIVDLIPKMMASGAIRSISDLRDAFKQINDQVSAQYKNMLGFAQSEDTATGSTQSLTGALLDMSKVNMDSLNNSLLSLQEQLDRLNREYTQNVTRYQDEYNVKLSRMQEDYQISVQQTMQEFANRRADLEAQYRNAQLDAEAKYQEQLRELRTKYLFDLEDALRNRDARQVLRLQAQYKMDKDNLQHNFEIENAARARQYKLELQQLARQEAQKLAEMAAAEALKEKRAAEDFARESAQRKQTYQDQLHDLQQSWDDKLKEEATKIADELGIRGKGVDDIYNLLKKFYGPSGVFDGLYQYSYDSLVEKGNAMLAALAGLAAQAAAIASGFGFGSISLNENVVGQETGGGTTPTPTPSPTPSPPSGGGGSKLKAKGGIDIASRPTTVTYGEAGPEAAIFLPLNKIMSGVSGLPASITGGGGQGMNGTLKVLLELSPDLEAKITENTLGKAARVITQVYRSRR